MERFNEPQNFDDLRLLDQSRFSEFTNYGEDCRVRYRDIEDRKCANTVNKFRDGEGIAYATSLRLDLYMLSL